MARYIIPETKAPELGTKEAALRGCVDLIARMCGKPEYVVRYWLDLYFQTRLAYAVEEEQRRAAERLEYCRQIQVKPIGPSEGEEQGAEDAAPEAPAVEPKAEKEPVAEQSATPPPPTGHATGQMIVDICPAKESTDEPDGFQPFMRRKQGAPRGNTRASDALIFKRETLNRLLRLRENGITIDQIVSASRGNLTDDVVLNILQARKMSISYYRKLAAALDKIEKEEITRT